MDLIILIILLLIVLGIALPIAAMTKASGSSNEVKALRRKVDLLESNLQVTSIQGERLDQELEDLKDRLEELGIAARTKEPTLRDLTPSEKPPPEAKGASKPEVAPEPLPSTAPDKVREKDPEKPKPMVASKRAESPVHSPVAQRSPTPPPAEPEVAKTAEEKPVKVEPKADAGSLEMKLGTYWFVRIGVMLLLTGAGILAYYNKQFFFDLSPLTKVIGLYVLSAIMGGVGFWLQRTREQFKNYGQVLVAGGFAGVYFTTYAAHIFPPVQIIPDPTVALLLLLAWGGFMVWVADRLKSETIALFAVGASYYATYVPLIHAGTVSHWVVLASNLILAVVAVVFMLRNRWLKMPVLSMSAAYAGFLIWRVRVLEDPSLTLVLIFALSLWAVYTAAVFLSRHKDFGDKNRSAFLTANNAAMFGLLSLEVLRDFEQHFWILPMAAGAALIACALAATKWLKDLPLSRKSYLTQGLVLVTLGIMSTNLSESMKGPILAAESVVLLFMGVRRKHEILQIGSFIAAVLAASYGVRDIGADNLDFLPSCLSIGAFLLFNSWLSHRSLDAEDESPLRPRVTFFAVLGIAVALVAYMTHGVNHTDGEWMPAILVAAAGLLTVSIYALRMREFVFLGQVPAAIGIGFSLDLAHRSPEFSWPLFVAFALSLGLAHWWRWQREVVLSSCPETLLNRKRVPLVVEAVFSAGVIAQLLVWLHASVGFGDDWLVLGSLMAAGAALYGSVTRAPFLAGFGQVFLALACGVQVMICLAGDGGDALRALVPIATMLLTNLALPVVASRIGRAAEFLRLGFGKIQAGYRIAASALGLLWIYRFVPSDYQVLVTVSIGALFLLANGWRPAKEWLGLAVAYFAVGALYLMTEFSNELALWPSLTVIVGLLGVQQLVRRREALQLPSSAHLALILGGGAALFFWVTIKMSAVMPVGEGQGIRSITWAILAVVYFTLGLRLKERWYRLMGLGVLGIALMSLAPIIWQMSTEMKIASFFVLGLVFVGLGFVYNHNKEQIKKLL